MIDQQIRHNDCGVSAIKTVYNILNKSISRNYIKDEVFLNEFGSRISDLKSFFNNNGCVANFSLLDVNTTKNKKEYFASLFPFIVPIDQKGELHFIVINGIKKNKLKVYDSTQAKVYYLTLEELKKRAHFSNSYLEQIPLIERLEILISQELSEYNIDKKAALKDNDLATLFNKITYFSYYKENYPFASSELEKKFIVDIIFNQEISLLPEHFRSLQYEKEIIKINAPLILTVKVDEAAEPLPPENLEVKENLYYKLLDGLKGNRKLWYIYIFTAIFAASVTQLAVFINQILIDKVLPSFQINILILFAIGVGIFSLFNMIIGLYKSFIQIHLGNILDKYFLGTFDQKLNDFSIAFIQSFKRGDLTERLSDSTKLKTFFLRFFTRILVDVFVSFYSLLLLLFINWKLTIIVFVVMLLFYIWFRVMTPILKSNEMKRFAIKANFFSIMIEKIEGIQVIKSFKIENLVSNKVLTNVDNLISIQTKVKYYSLINNFIVSIITLIASLLILTLLSKESIENQTITIGQIITFVALSAKIFSSLSRILSENLDLQENLVILNRFFDFNEKNTYADNKNNINEININSIEFKDVKFEYLPNMPILKDINMTINQGDKIKIEGKNGSGKSTFCKILSLLYSPTHGEILINNIEHKLYNRNVLRDTILLTTNEDILFNESLLFNITFGKKIETEAIVNMAKQIDFYDFIASNPEGLNYRINENGRNLSTGQRKKVLLLRALLSDAEVIILDEVLSGIDTSSRKIIENTLTESNKTVLVISHEPTEGIEFNKTYLLNKGELTLNNA